jgi:hypothetical protein
MPAELEQIILKALDKKKERRYQTAAEMAAALQQLRISHTESSTREHELYERTRITARDMAATAIHKPGPDFSRLVLPFAGFVVVALLAVVIFVVRPFGGGEEPEDGPTPTEATFADSFLIAEQALAENRYTDLLQIAPELLGSANATDAARLQLRKMHAAAQYMAGDSSSALATFEELRDQDESITFSRNEFPRPVADRWQEFIKPEPPPLTEREIAISVENWELFKPLRVEFDGTSETYEGNPLEFTVTEASRLYEIRLLAGDDYRFTDAVKPGSAKRTTKKIVISPTEHRLKILAEDSESGRALNAYVFIDGVKVGGGFQTPNRINVAAGPHKIEVSLDGERTVGAPKYVDINSSHEIRFSVKSE